MSANVALLTPAGRVVTDGSTLIISGGRISVGGISAANLPTGIDAAKIADGSVSNTEFQYVNGVTSAIQTQLDAKLVKASNLSDLANAATARTNLGLGTLATQSGTFSGTSSGTNTGDQTITLTGNVTGSGTGTFAATIAASAVTNAMLAGSIAASKLVGSDIATVGTVTTGTWHGTAIDLHSYSNAATASAANTVPKGGSDGKIASGWGLPKIIEAKGSTATATGSGVQTLYSVSIPANSLGTNKVLRGQVSCRRTTGSGNLTFTVTYGGTTVLSYGAVAGPNYHHDFWISGDASTSAQRAYGRLNSGTNTATAVGTAAVDSTSAQTLTVSIDFATDADVATLDHVCVELLE